MVLVPTRSSSSRIRRPCRRSSTGWCRSESRRPDRPNENQRRFFAAGFELDFFAVASRFVVVFFGVFVAEALDESRRALSRAGSDLAARSGVAGGAAVDAAALLGAARPARLP